MKPKEVGKVVQSTRQLARGGGRNRRGEVEDGGRRASEHKAADRRRPDVDNRGLG